MNGAEMTVTPKRLLIAAAVLVAALLAYLLFGRGPGGLALQVQVSGTANSTAAGQFRATGAGVSDSPFGSVTLTAAGSVELEANCVVVSGTGDLVTALGTLHLQPAGDGRACFSQKTLQQLEGGGQPQATAKVEATGTAGSLLGRHGTLKAHGSYDPSSDRFSVLFSGRLH
jgi:hypothetical protein